MNKFMLTKWIVLFAIPLCVMGNIIKESHNYGTRCVFLLVEGGDPYDPLDYIEYYGWTPYIDCPGMDYICAIEVYNDDIYNEQNAPEENYIGKPQVAVGSSLSNEISYALSSGLDPYYSLTGRIIWQTE